MMCLASALAAEWFSHGYSRYYALAWLEHVLLMAALYCLNLYFGAVNYRGWCSAGSDLDLLSLVVCAAVALSCAIEVAAGTPPFEVTVSGVLGFYRSIGFLTAGLFCGYHASKALGSLRIAWSVTGIGLLSIALAEVAITPNLLQAVAEPSTAALWHLSAPVTFGARIALFLIGITTLGVAHPRRAWSLRTIRRQGYRRLADLGIEVSRAFRNSRCATARTSIEAGGRS